MRLLRIAAYDGTTVSGRAEVRCDGGTPLWPSCGAFADASADDLADAAARLYAVSLRWALSVRTQLSEQMARRWISE